MVKKITLLLLLIIASFTKELTPKETARINFEKELFNDLHDPDSYQFVEMSDLDTVFSKDYYQDRINRYQDFNDVTEKRKEKNVKEFESYSTFVKKRTRKDYDNLINAYDSIIDVDKFKIVESNDSLKLLSGKEIRNINTIIGIRSKNAMGVLIKQNYQCVFSSDLGTIKYAIVE